MTLNYFRQIPASVRYLYPCSMCRRSSWYNVRFLTGNLRSYCAEHLPARYLKLIKTNDKRYRPAREDA